MLPALAPALLLRALLLPLGLYKSTDFEVHRNWLAITHSLPVSRWYYEDTSPWTLDYPPLFAYFEWALSQVAGFVDPKMLVVSNLEYASRLTVLFQRISVIVCDAVLFIGAYAVGGGGVAPVALTLLNPALLIVDHIHFQYNGMMLGLLLLSAASIERGHTYMGSFLFCALLNFKQIFLYTAPVYFVYLLRKHCGCVFGGKALLQIRVLELLKLGGVVLATFGVFWLPVILTGQVLQAASRLFPFGRGLTHSYWAPNVWALYNTADRALVKLGFGEQRGQSATAGLAEVYESSALWTIPPKATFLLTAIAYIPLLVVIWRQTLPAANSVAPAKTGGTAVLPLSKRPPFTLYVALGSAVSFAFGWHVHEKAILMVTIPLLATVTRFKSRKLAEATAALSAVATFSILPLMPPDLVETSVKWALLLGCHKFEDGILRRCGLNGAEKMHRGPFAMLRIWHLPGSMAALGMGALGLFHDGGLHQRLFKGRMEFLPLLLISDFCTVLVLASFLRIFWLVSSSPLSAQ